MVVFRFLVVKSSTPALSLGEKPCSIHSLTVPTSEGPAAGSRGHLQRRSGGRGQD